MSEIKTVPVFTQEMSDKGELPPIGSYFFCEGKKVKAISTTKEEGGVVTFLTEQGGIECCWCNKSWVEPIPAPIEFVDGAAYMFNCDTDVDVIGLFSKGGGLFVINNGAVFNACFCTNIRLMTVESK
jgi:hypothetical protein